MEYKSKKEELFDNIFRMYVEDVYHACLYVSRNEDLAQEVTQQAFVNFYERFEEVKPECVKAYLIRAARNLMNNYYRDHKKFVENDENGELPGTEKLIEESVEERYIAAEEQEARTDLLKRILEELKENHEGWYDVIYRLYVQEMDSDAIAEELNVSKDVIYTRTRRAKTWIKKNYQIDF